MKTLLVTLLASLSFAQLAHADLSDVQMDAQLALENSELLYITPGRPAPYPDDRGRGGRDWDHGRGRGPGRGDYDRPGRGPGHPGRPGYPPGRGARTQYIRCESQSYRYAECFVGSSRIYAVRVAKQMSSSACTEGRSYGYFGDRIWVDDGCRATFEVISD